MTLGDGADYVKTCFKHKVIPQIFGCPAFDQIEELKKKILANAASVSSTLGGGAHGLMGLTLNAADYDQVAPGTPFVRPPLPPAPVYPTPCTYIQGERIRQDYQRDISEFRQVVDVERALLTQIQGTFEEEYLAEILNQDSHILDGPISDIWDYLFAEYGQVDSGLLVCRTQ